MTVWTFYNHGTDGSSIKSPDKSEIVNLFGNNDRSPEFLGKLIMEGVGGIGDPTRTLYGTRHIAEGPYIWKTRVDGPKWPSLVEGAFGIGVSTNVRNVLTFVSMLHANNQLPSAINMLGWSRGAVTCIRIAYFLWQSQDPAIRAIPINIFAVDPVAGARHNDEVDATTLTPNVQNYVATLAMDERRRFFKPIVAHRLTIQSPIDTDVWVLPIPGTHSNTAKMNNDAGKLVFNLAYRFLHSCSTPVEPMRHYCLSNDQAWSLYERIMTGQGNVERTPFGSAAALGGVPYARATEVSAYRGSDFFVNTHAREIFKRVFPVTYEAYFGVGSLAINTSGWNARYQAPMAPEMARMSAAFRTLLGEVVRGPSSPGSASANVHYMLTKLSLID